jgi:hypothetical protein
VEDRGLCVTPPGCPHFFDRTGADHRSRSWLTVEVCHIAGPIDIVGREDNKGLTTFQSVLFEAADRTGRFCDIMK